VHVDVCWVRCARGMEWPFGRGLFVHIRNTLKVRAFFKRILMLALFWNYVQLCASVIKRHLGRDHLVLRSRNYSVG